MKVIYCIADTLRRDHVSVYGDAPWGKIHTPNLAKFAHTAAVFDNAFIGSFPTGPNRRDTAMGRTQDGCAFNPWVPLADSEDTFPRLLGETRVPSMLITDTQNTVLGGKVNLQRDFTAWVCNRGQEGDGCWLDAGAAMDIGVPIELTRYDATRWEKILVNRAHRRVETDWFAPGTYSLAIEWLERNYKRDDFFLWIDTFDPHEPWDPPQHYIDRYDPGYKGRVFEAPPGGFRRVMGITRRELKHTRARYAGEVTMVDAWFGRMLAKLEALGILDETLIIFTSDHGTPLAGPGDFDLMRKPAIIGPDGLVAAAGKNAPGQQTYLPLAIHTVRIPLIIRPPGMRKQRRIKAYAQPWDNTATMLDAFGIPKPSNMIGRSLLPFVAGQSRGQEASPFPRDAAFCGLGPIAQAMTERWMYTCWAGQRGPALYDLRNDPGCTKNVVAGQPDAARRMHKKLAAFLRGQGVGEDHIERYDAAV